MKIAIPVSNGLLCMHFGHCEVFSVVDVSDSDKTVSGWEEMVPPPHEPGLLPKWLASKNVNMIVSGGMGQRAQDLFAQSGIKVITGAPSEKPEKIIEKVINGTLVTGDNVCDH